MSARRRSASDSMPMWFGCPGCPACRTSSPADREEIERRLGISRRRRLTDEERVAWFEAADAILFTRMTRFVDGTPDGRFVLHRRGAPASRHPTGCQALTVLRITGYVGTVTILDRETGERWWLRQEGSSVPRRAGPSTKPDGPAAS